MATLISTPVSLHTSYTATISLRASRSVAFSLEFGPPRWSTSSRFRFRCVSSRSEVQSAERLREQLEALQQEAEQVRGRGLSFLTIRRCVYMWGNTANSARLRFMRLSHVVEQLRQRAAMDVRMGNEDSARLLLTEKHKVMRALEASRHRAELLEQLAAKLNVAISMKETVLIEALSTAPLSRPDDDEDASAVHHVSPRAEEVRADEDVIRARAGLNSPQDLEDHSLG